MKHVAAIALVLSVSPAMAMDTYDAADAYRSELIKMFRYQPAVTLAVVCGMKPGIDYFAVMDAIKDGQQRALQQYAAKADNKPLFNQMAERIFGDVASRYQAMDSSIGSHGATMETCLDLRRSGVLEDAQAFVGGRHVVRR